MRERLGPLGEIDAQRFNRSKRKNSLFHVVSLIHTFAFLPFFQLRHEQSRKFNQSGESQRMDKR